MEKHHSELKPGDVVPFCWGLWRLISYCGTGDYAVTWTAIPLNGGEERKIWFVKDNFSVQVVGPEEQKRLEGTIWNP